MVLKLCVAIPVVVAALLLTKTSDVFAQDSTSSSPRGCWRGRPAPACDMFLLTELNFFGTVVNATGKYSSTFMIDSTPRTFQYEEHPAQWKFSSEVGGMVNRGKKTAFGGTVLLDASPNGLNIGLKARYRRWLTSDGVALDVGAGFRTTRDDVPNDYSDTYGYGWPPAAPRNSIGFTGDVAINARDYVAVVTRLDVGRYDKRLQPTVSLGVRAGSRPAVIGLAGIGVTYTALIVLFFAAFDDRI